MWFSTRAGIDRYDGSSFRYYPLVTSISQSGVVSRSNFVEADPSGNIWAYDANGNLFRYVDSSDSFIHDANLSQKLGKGNIALRGIFFDASGKMFVFGSFGLAEYDYLSTKEVRSVLLSGADNPPDICAIYALPDNRYAVGSLNGVYIMSRQSDGYNLDELKFATSGSRRVHGMAFDKANNILYFGTFGGDIFTWNLNDGDIEKVTNISILSSVRNLNIIGNDLYITTDGYGLLIWNMSSAQTTEHYTAKNYNQNTLSSDAIYDIHVDKDNRIWLATYSGGVSVMDKNLPDFRFIYNSEKNSLPYNNSISSILATSNGQMWFGSNNGLSTYSDGKWHHLLNNDPGTRHLTLALCEDNQGNVWAGGVFGISGICIDKKTLKVKDRLSDIIARNRKKDVKNLYAVFCDSHGTMWFGGLFGKTIAYNPESGKYNEYKTHSVNSISEFKNNLIIGTAYGLFHLDTNKGEFVPWPTLPIREKSVFRNYINYIYPFGETLWFSTEQGLVCYDISKETMKVYTRSDGLASNVVYAIRSDVLGKIWVSTDRGLSSIDPVNNKIYSFDIKNGLKEDQFNPRAVASTADKRLLFGTVNGVLSFDPEQISKRPISGKLYFNDLLINHRSVYDPESTYKPVSSVDNLREITLQDDENNFSLNFSAINYSYASRIYYRWKLIGYDKAFIDSRSGSNPSYANVPSGKYQFVAEAVDAVDKIVLDSRTLSIEVKPPWWDTWYARLTYGIILILLIYFIFKIIRNRIEQRDYERKILYFTDTAHEIKTPITLILGPLQKLCEDDLSDKNKKSYLDMAIKHTKKLNLLVNRLMDFQRAEMHAMKLEVARYDIVDFIKSQTDKFYPSAIQKQIKLTFRNELTDEYLWFDISSMEIIISNLISNALKYTPEGGTIDVSLLPYGRKGIIIEVSDSGIGISKESQKQLFQRFYRGRNAINSGENGSGIGLLLSRTLTELHGGKLEVSSELNKGSIFRVTLNYGNSHLKNNRNVSIIKDQYQDNISEPGAFTPLINDSVNTIDDYLSSNTTLEKPLILVVEDNEDLRLFIRRSLEENYHIEEAPDADTAIILLSDIIPDLIISDVVMPGMDGYEFCRKLKSEISTSHIPLVLLTALDEKSNMIQGYDCGADNYITKPFDITLVKMKIENIINSRRLLKEQLMKNIGGDQTVSMQNNADDLFLRRVISKLEANITNPDYSIDQLCLSMKISRSTFYNKIKGLTNHTPNDFVRIFRLNKAAQLLKNGEHNVNEVADLTGFADTKYFSTIFKKHFGVSPSKYA